MIGGQGITGVGGYEFGFMGMAALVDSGKCQLEERDVDAHSVGYGTVAPGAISHGLQTRTNPAHIRKGCCSLQIEGCLSKGLLGVEQS